MKIECTVCSPDEDLERGYREVVNQLEQTRSILLNFKFEHIGYEEKDKCIPKLERLLNVVAGREYMPDTLYDCMDMAMNIFKSNKHPTRGDSEWDTMLVLVDKSIQGLRKLI